MPGVSFFFPEKKELQMWVVLLSCLLLPSYNFQMNNSQPCVKGDGAYGPVVGPP